MSRSAESRVAARLAEPPVYDRVFWLAYAANLALVSANALTFRFAELVAFLGGTERTVGIIVSTGICGGLVARLFLGQIIDRYGTRRLWLGSTVMFLVSCLFFLTCSRLGWELYAARVGFATSIAAMFTCSIVHVQARVPANRRTEVIGNLGSSGFVGMVIGALLGDLILNVFADTGRTQFMILFGLAGALAVAYLAIVYAITRDYSHQRPPEAPPAYLLLVRYWPGNIVLVALMMGVGITVTTVFLTRFATDRGFGGIGPFFFSYAVSAFLFRIFTRSWGTTVGRHRMVLAGLTGHAIGHWFLPLVQQEWQLGIPAIACGFGHALLFPAVVSKGSGSFPPAYRGVGTTLTLGFFDLGAALSAPLLGSIIDQIGFTSMFLASGTLSISIAGIYRVTAARTPDVDHPVETVRPQPVDAAVIGLPVSQPQTVELAALTTGGSHSESLAPCSAES